MQRWRPNHPHLTTQKSFYVEISRARDRAEIVTEDREALKEQLEAAIGERIAALDAIGPDRAKGREARLETDRSGGRERDWLEARELGVRREPKGVDRGLSL